MWNRIRSSILLILAILAGVMSICTALTEITTVIFNVTHKQLSLFGLALKYSGSNRYVRTLVVGIPLLYISFFFLIHRYLFVCFFRSLFLLKVPGVECYHLYKHHTDVYALSFNASYLCRLQFSLCYHYFVLLQMPTAAYQSIALSAILGQMQTVKFLGKEFNFYMPAILILISLFTLYKMLRTITKKKKSGLLEANDLITCKKMVVTTVMRRQRMMREQELSSTGYSYNSPSVVTHDFSPIP